MKTTLIGPFPSHGNAKYAADQFRKALDACDARGYEIKTVERRFFDRTVYYLDVTGGIVSTALAKGFLVGTEFPQVTLTQDYEKLKVFKNPKASQQSADTYLI